MKTDPVAQVYANALVHLGQEKGTLDAVLEEIQGLANLLRQEPRLLAALRSPGVPERVKLRIVDEALAGLSPTVRNFVKLVIRKRRQENLVAMLSFFVDRYNEVTGRLEAHVKSAVPLAPEARDRLIRAIERRTSRQAVVREEVDPSLLGGAVVRIEDFLFDGSLRWRLVELAERLESRKIESEAGYAL